MDGGKDHDSGAAGSDLNCLGPEVVFAFLLTVGNSNSAENQNPFFFSQVLHFDQSHYCGQRMIRPVRAGGHGLVSNRQVFDVQTLTTALLLDPHVSGRTYKVRPSPCSRVGTVIEGSVGAFESM